MVFEKAVLHGKPKFIYLPPLKTCYENDDDFSLLHKISQKSNYDIPIFFDML